MLRLLVTLAAVKAATVCQDDLTTPSTDTHAAGSILLQSSQTRDRDRQVWDGNTKLNASRSEKSYAFLPWEVLYLLQGDRQLLWDAPQAPEAGFASLLICLSCILLTVCLCAWSLASAGDDPIKGTGRASLPSMRPSLEPSRGQCRPPEGPWPQSPPPTPLPEEASLSLRQRTFTSVCCPDLVVPIGSQSIVGVPSLAAVAALDAGDVLDIVDPIGMPLLKVELQLRPGAEGARIRGPGVRGSSGTEAPLLVLRNLRPEPRGSLLNINVTGDLAAAAKQLSSLGSAGGWVNTSAMALAFLRTSGGQERLEICSPDLSIFASLAQEPSGKFVLRSGSEETLCMIFHSTFFRESQHNAIAVTDGSNQVLSRTCAADLQVPEPGRFYSLQVFSGVDLGVVLCCLFFMEGRAIEIF
ncbi:unnamed protein product [Symbiodinium sp. CCMP2456]|nr:unnamed protein product [Symbiodinium sp. CCMP2456]